MSSLPQKPKPNFVAMSSNADLQLVPETLLKKRHDLDALKASRAAQELKRGSRKRSKADKNQVKVIRPETILIQARQRRKSQIRFNRVNKKGMQKRASNKSVVKTKVWDNSKDEEVEETDGTHDLSGSKKEGDGESGDNEGESQENLQKISYRSNSVGCTTVFAVLIRPTVNTTPRTVKTTLTRLRLRRMQEGVFLPYNSMTRKMLHLVEPYVLYGIPSTETIADLVRRRGFCRVEGKRTPLADNNVIELELGDVGLICVEDLVQVLSNVGSDGGEDDQSEIFGKVTKFLWPFQLTARKSKFQRRMLDMKDGKLYGDQGDAMNGYIREML